MLGVVLPLLPECAATWRSLHGLRPKRERYVSPIASLPNSLRGLALLRIAEKTGEDAPPPPPAFRALPIFLGGKRSAQALTLISSPPTQPSWASNSHAAVSDEVEEGDVSIPLPSALRVFRSPSGGKRSARALTPTSSSLCASSLLVWLKLKNKK